MNVICHARFPSPLLCLGNIVVYISKSVAGEFDALGSSQDIIKQDIVIQPTVLM